jgi:hypothetical protein
MPRWPRTRGASLNLRTAALSKVRNKMTVENAFSGG